MDFQADQYYEVSLQRMRQAKKVYHEGDSYALAMYLAGLAVESMLRAFRWIKDPSFEGRHDLSDLLKASKLFEIDSDYMRLKGAKEEAIQRSRRNIRIAMNDIVLLWQNNLRFASESTLKAHLIKLRKVQGIKGDPLKKNALDLIEAAQTVVDRGVMLWTPPTKS